MLLTNLYLFEIEINHFKRCDNSNTRDIYMAKLHASTFRYFRISIDSPFSYDPEKCICRTELTNDIARTRTFEKQRKPIFVVGSVDPKQTLTSFNTGKIYSGKQFFHFQNNTIRTRSNRDFRHTETRKAADPVAIAAIAKTRYFSALLRKSVAVTRRKY